MIRREEADTKLAAMFYGVATQSVLLFGSETWVLLAAMEITMDGTLTGFLRQIMGNRHGGRRTGRHLSQRQKKCGKRQEISWQQDTSEELRRR